ncbi:MAG TPA: GxGYxYP family putative glycoside hydrolase [Candidatus Brocadiia bacterium]|nr:GxGYxYP family putative glycoside hydrolase [Candidatus Brocadiia bacterium]
MFTLRLFAAATACLVLTSCAATQEKETAMPIEPICVLDLTALNDLDLKEPKNARLAWDTLHLAASAQGIVNRDAPRLFFRFMKHPDDFWFDYLRQDGNWLADRETVPLADAHEVLRRFAGRFKGVVVYKGEHWATSNLASTIAGVEDRLCLRFDDSPDSIYSAVINSDLLFTRDVKRLYNDDGSPMFSGKAGTLIPGTDIPSTGSAKCDAHLWLKANYLDAGKTSDYYMAYYIDAYWLTDPAISGLSNCTLTNHDFFIANKSLFFDLHVWEEESPVDDPGQKPGTDLRTLRALMRSMHDRAAGRIFHIGGFTPWAWKYTDHGRAGSKHGGVDTEWKYAMTISSYNGIMDADALGYSGMANASFYQHFPMKERYPQQARPTIADLKAQGLIREDGSVLPATYATFYMGDYDSAAWLNYHVPLWWQDEAHGKTPCMWAFNANLDKRAPQAMDYARRHAAPTDWFISGDNGAGYLNPGMLADDQREKGIPAGWEAWTRHNSDYYRKYDLTITGFIIDGHAPGMPEAGWDAYMAFSPDGIVGQKMPAQGVYKSTMPFIRMRTDLHGNPPEAGKWIADNCGKDLPHFMFIRTILKSPSWHRDVMANALKQAGEEKLKFVDPYTFFLLLKTHEGGKLQK